MAKKTTFTANLSSRSFKHTATLVRRYQRQLAKKIELFCKRVAEVGEAQITSVLLEHVFSGQTIGSVKLIAEGDGSGRYRAYVQVTSDAILFLEFGSGTEGRDAPQAPHASQFNAGPGTFTPRAPRQNPDYDNWENPEGWMYYGDDGKLHLSFGMAASYPMYQGFQEMILKYVEIAHEVFA